MKVPNVAVVSRMGECLGICWCRPRKVSGMSCRWEWAPEDETYHVIRDVHAEGSSFVVHKSCRVGGESRQGHVQHVVVLGRQRKGWSRERRLLMLPNVVKLALDKEKKNPTVTFLYHVFDSPENLMVVFFYLQLQGDTRIGNGRGGHHGVFNFCILVHFG